MSGWVFKDGNLGMRGLTACVLVSLVGVCSCSSVPGLGILKRGDDAKLATSASSDANAAPGDETGPSPDSASVDPVLGVESQPNPESTPEPIVNGLIPSDIFGLTADQLDGQLGAPAFVRQEGRGTYRRYDGRVCNLIVLMTSDASGRQVATVLEATSFNSSAQKPELQTCLNGF